MQALSSSTVQGTCSRGSRLLPQVVIDCSGESGESSAADHPSLQPSCKARVGTVRQSRRNILLASNLCWLRAHTSRNLAVPSQGTLAQPLPDVQPLGDSRICCLGAVSSGSPRGQKRTLQWPLLMLLCSHLSPASALVGLGRDRKSSHCSDSSKRIRSRTDTT